MSAFSCGRAGSGSDGSTFKIPWPDGAGGLALQDIQLRTFSDPRGLNGTYASILIEPGDGGDHLAGVRPVGRYVRTSAGVMIPSDYLTLQGVTTYAHVERLHDLDVSVGADTALSWPLSLGLDAKVMSFGAVSTNNAIYDAKLNSLLLVPYTAGAVPVTLNPGVLAHEHFHFIFQSVVLSRVNDPASQTSCSGAVSRGGSSQAAAGLATRQSTEGATTSSGAGADGSSGAGGGTRGDLVSDNAEKSDATAKAMPSKIYNAFLLRGMNEGFADFYGWIYSSDDSFVAKSLPSEDHNRRLDIEPGRLPSEDLTRHLLVDAFHPAQILPEMVRAHNAYFLGTVYARFLRGLAKSYESNDMTVSSAKASVARALIASLPIIADEVTAKYESGFLSANTVLKPLLSRLPPLSKEGCMLLEEFHSPDEDFSRPSECPTPVQDITLSKPAHLPKDDRPASATIKPVNTPAPAPSGGGNSPKENLDLAQQILDAAKAKSETKQAPALPPTPSHKDEPSDGTPVKKTVTAPLKKPAVAPAAPKLTIDIPAPTEIPATEEKQP